MYIYIHVYVCVFIDCKLYYKIIYLYKKTKLT